jgi:hypothetical protein
MTIVNCKFLDNYSPKFSLNSYISVTHYYHWSAELFFGFWRAYSSLDPSINSTGHTTLPTPRRMIFVHIDADHWRDYASMNQWVLRSSFPSIGLEFYADWEDRAATGRLFVFDRVVLADRSAAMHGFNYLRTQRTASETFALPGSFHWWNTIRNNVIHASGLRADTGEGTTSNPVITYISRQEWGRRMLIQKDHEELVAELHKLRDNYGYEVNIVSMDKLSRKEQLQLAARTTVSPLPHVISPVVVVIRFSDHDTDHDGRTRKRPYILSMDETLPPIDGTGILLPRWVCARLRIYHQGLGHGALQLLEGQVRVIFPSHRLC